VGVLQRRDHRPDDASVAELAAARAEVTALRAQIDRMEGALDGLPTGVVLVDVNGRAVFRNRAAATLGGTPHGDVLLRTAVEQHARVAIAGTASGCVVELFGRPRRVINVEAHSLRAGGAIVALDDISERARLDRVRTDFVANISHELKTPVGALAVLAEALADETNAAVTSRLAHKMIGEAHRAANAIDDLLELSRIELGGAAVRQPFDVAVILPDVAQRAAAACEQRGTRLLTEVIDGPLTVLGDRRQLVSALGNLVDNAIKYSEPGSEVELTARHAGPWIEFDVRDHGIGIPARDLDRIFERFYRVDRARSRDTGGTGLGLAIVRHVVTNHEGEITLHSVEGEGSTFTMRIPTS
jgi:two-component system sensor histidine kinase SenX3